MSYLRRLIDRALRRSQGRAGMQNPDNLEYDADVEGCLEPNTAALSEGAPPAGADGRTQPSGTSPDPRPERGPSEGEVQNLPG
jgi:hypothetical protein